MRFRRRRSEAEQAAAAEDAAVAPGTDAAAADAGEVPGRSHGPWDEAEVDLSDGTSRVDLGSLLVTPREGLELQLQVEEETGTPLAVVLAGERGAVELRAFAAPRHGDIWDELRRRIAAEVTRRGGTVTEGEGPWGPELRVVLTMTTPDGRTGQQPSRVFGIRGPRWLLRATFFGEPALEPKEDGLVESALRDVVVRRGSGPMAPGDPLPLSVPPQLLRRKG